MAGARVTDRDLEFLKMLATAYLMTPASILANGLYAMKTEADSKRKRRQRTAALATARFINRYPKKHEADRRPAFYLAKKGTEELARRLGQPALLAKPTKLQCGAAQINHSVAVGQFLLNLPVAFQHRTDLELLRAYHEFEPINPLAEPDQQIRLYSLLREEPRLDCRPDAAFLIQRALDRVPYYLEYETGFNGFKEAARKAIYYRELASQRRHLVHFPEATSGRFLVLMICPKDRFRDQVASTIASHDPDGHQFWRLVSLADATPERLLTQPVIRTTSSAELQLLVKPA
jgi:hypothetical protein